jgi:pre-mRNA-processing factor 19
VNSNAIGIMSFTCELSGEPLQTIIAADGSSSSIVVTPSGHLCQRRLLLQKLAANGGHDPWDATRPLREDEVIELRCMVPPVIMAPRSPAKSVQVTLQHLQQDYDAVLLELFDTRKLLAETREELSQALYQNDAAVRVVWKIIIVEWWHRDMLDMIFGFCSRLFFCNNNRWLAWPRNGIKLGRP